MKDRLSEYILEKLYPVGIASGDEASAASEDDLQRVYRGTSRPAGVDLPKKPEGDVGVYWPVVRPYTRLS